MNFPHKTKLLTLQTILRIKKRYSEIYKEKIDKQMKWMNVCDEMPCVRILSDVGSMVVREPAMSDPHFGEIVTLLSFFQEKAVHQILLVTRCLVPWGQQFWRDEFLIRTPWLKFSSRNPTWIWWWMYEGCLWTFFFSSFSKWFGWSFKTWYKWRRLP